MREDRCQAPDSGRQQKHGCQAPDSPACREEEEVGAAPGTQAAARTARMPSQQEVDEEEKNEAEEKKDQVEKKEETKDEEEQQDEEGKKGEEEEKGDEDLRQALLVDQQEDQQPGAAKQEVVHEQVAPLQPLALATPQRLQQLPQQQALQAVMPEQREATSQAPPAMPVGDDEVLQNLRSMVARWRRAYCGLHRMTETWLQAVVDNEAALEARTEQAEAAAEESDAALQSALQELARASERRSQAEARADGLEEKLSDLERRLGGAAQASHEEECAEDCAEASGPQDTNELGTCGLEDNSELATYKLLTEQAEARAVTAERELCDAQATQAAWRAQASEAEDAWAQAKDDHQRVKSKLATTEAMLARQTRERDAAEVRAKEAELRESLALLTEAVSAAAASSSGIERGRAGEGADYPSSSA